MIDGEIPLEVRSNQLPDGMIRVQTSSRAHGKHLRNHVCLEKVIHRFVIVGVGTLRVRTRHEPVGSRIQHRNDGRVDQTVPT